MTTQHELLASDEIRTSLPILHETALLIADPQVRYRGTIGGNVANGDPGNDMPALMLTLGATYRLEGPGGGRDVAASDFYQGAYFTALEPGELLTSISIPAAAAGHGYAYEKLKRKVGDYATAAAAVVLTMASGKVASCAIGLTNLHETPLLAMFVVSLTVMFILSPPLALIMLMVAPALLFTALQAAHVGVPRVGTRNSSAGEVANVVEEDVTGVRVVKGFGQESRELDRLTERSREMFASKVRLVAIQARLQPAMQSIPAFGQVAVLALGGWLAIQGSISYGTFLAFSTYMLLITPPVRQLAAILAVGQLARAGAERIYDLLDSTPHVQDKPRRDRSRRHERRGALR